MAFIYVTNENVTRITLFFRVHGIDLAGSNFIFLVINRTYEAIGHTFCMSKRGKLYVNFVT